MTEKERLSQLEEVVSEILIKQDRLAEEVANLSLKVASNSIDIASLKVVVTSLETKVDRLDAKMDRLETKVSHHTNMIVDLQHDVRSGQAELKTSMEVLLQAIRGQ